MALRVYLAGPLFSRAERAFLRALAEALRERGFEVFLPQDEAAPALVGPSPDPARAFAINRGGLLRADAVVAWLDGADADSGTAWECGYASGLGKFVVGVRTDPRRLEDEGINLMLRRSLDAYVHRPADEERVAPLADAIAGALFGARRA